MPRAFTPAQIRRLGRLLNEARFDFATDEERAQWATSLAENCDLSQEYLTKELTKSVPGFALATIAAAKLGDAAVRQGLRFTYQTRVVDAVIKQESVVYGIPVEPIPQKAHARIPEHVFESGSIDWDSSELRSGGLLYRDVRLISSRVLKEKTGKAARGGRPSLKWKIWAAMKIAESEIDNFRNQPKNFQQQIGRASCRERV